MAGLNDVTQAAFEGGKPGPKEGTKKEPSALAVDSIQRQSGANLILDALKGDGLGNTRRERALKRRRLKNTGVI